MDQNTQNTTPRVHFTDTKIAFAHLSDFDLRKAQALFHIIGQPLVVKVAPKLTEISLRMGLPIKTLVRHTVFSHFCGGETLDACAQRIQQLAKYRVGTILDFAREGAGKEEDFEIVLKEIKRTIELASKQPRDIPFAVFKPTGLANMELLAKLERQVELNRLEQAAWTRVQKRFYEICSLAAKLKVRIMIDAEESWIQNTIDTLVRDLMQRYNRDEAIVFNTVQFYRHDRLNYIKTELERARVESYHLGFKLVRGAYLEKENTTAEMEGRPSPLNPSKEATDRDFNAGLRFCVENLDLISLVSGTHNEESCSLLVDLMIKKGIPSSDRRVTFAQLLGMSDNLTFNLAACGYNVAKYVPYGKIDELLPYLTRRAQENSSVAGQSGREQILLESEIKRRHQSRRRT